MKALAAILLVGTTGEDPMWHLRNMHLALKDTALRDSKN